MMDKNIGVTIVGGTGYGAKEFLRLSESHPSIQIVQVISQSSPNKELQDLHPNLNKLANLKTESEINFKLLDKFKYKFIVLTLPHDSSAEFIRLNSKNIELLNIHILDFSGCCRLKNPERRKEFYPESLQIDNGVLQDFEFGLPEVMAPEIANAKHISNPGCYATAGILSLSPLSNHRVQNVIIDGKSGSSGAGKSLNNNFHHPELNGSAFAYKIGSHRHQPEIQENLKFQCENFLFCPNVIPISRGMMVTSYVTLNEPVSLEKIKKEYEDFYKHSYFVKIFDSPPKISSVVGSNFCHLHITVKDNLVVIVSVIDNLIKGMAGQAIQNINLVSRNAEHLGLEQPGIGLV